MNKKTATYILAEMASSHEGEPRIAEFIIKSAARAKADGILLQLIDLDTYIVSSDKDYENTKSFYMGQDSWRNLIKKANSFGLDVWANVYDLKSAEFCQGKKIKGFKLHSSNLENEDLIREVVKTKKDLLLSIGGLERKEIKRFLKLIYSINKKTKITLMYGLQNFPTKPEGVNLNFIRKLARDFKLPFGYQDHSEPLSPASTYLSVLSIAEGALFIEKHITHNRNFKGQDYAAALNPNEFVDFVKDIKITDEILNKKPEEISSEELKYRAYKSDMKVVAKNIIKRGKKFNKDNLAVMRAKQGEIPGRELKKLLGRKSKLSYKKFESIKKKEI